LVAKARNLSELASLPKTETDKIEENRRVELTSTMHEVLDPVELSDTVRTSNPPTVRFKMNAKTDQPVNDWTLLVNFHDEEIKRFTNDLVNPELPKRLDWSLVQEGDSILKTPGPLQFILTARDAVGKSGFAYGLLPVEQVTLRKKRKEYRNDREFEQFSLILFNFNKSEIGEKNQAIIDFMKGRIKPTSLFSIAGYTDRTGDAAYNRTLSKQRAGELARLLGAPASSAQGFGEDQLLYTNDLPEGRFYCRTVNVSVETPVQYRE
jgi:outer membrane protein OmpA-like peptidoglycan-associated protein